MAKCPVCEFTSDDNAGFCPRCSWEFKVWITDVSQEEKRKYQKRLEIAQQNWKALQAVNDKKPTAGLPERENKPSDALYSEETPVPDLERDPFDTVEEFQAKINRYKPVPAGTATLIKEKYDIQTGRFPIKVSWADWTKNIEGIPAEDRDLHVIAERNLARSIYEAGPTYCLFVRLMGGREKAFAGATVVSQIWIYGRITA